MPLNPEFVRPDWPAPSQVKVATTTRLGGTSQGKFASLNMGQGPDHDPGVDENRRAVIQSLRMKAKPRWLRQVHGSQCVDAARVEDGVQADASVTFDTDNSCVIMTADCLPVVFTSIAGDRAGAAHAGWRGLVGGVLEATIAALDTPPEELFAWIGPAISGAVYEVDAPVRDAFLHEQPQDESAFVSNRPGHWLADLPMLAAARLNRVGIHHVSSAELCTYAEESRFYSYRRDGSTGRMATFIWLAED